MNRPIKFRVFDKDTNEMIIYDFFNPGFLEPYKNIQDPTKLKYRPSFDSYTANELMQFTGLHDCDGKEIFEGDLVKIIDPYHYKGILGETFEVEFSDGVFCFYKDRKDGRDFYPLFEVDVKIIGNIFEGIKNGS